MKKILFINCTRFKDEFHGKAIVIKGIYEFLANNEEIECSVVSIGHGMPGYSIDPPKKMKKVLNIFTGLFAHIPLQLSVYRSSRITRDIQNRIDGFAPDVIIYDTLRTGQYSSHLRIPAAAKEILYMDDLYSKRYSQIIKFEKSSGTRLDVLGNFARNIPPSLANLLTYPLIRKLAVIYEKISMSKAEMNYSKKFYKVLLINKEEVQELRYKVKASNIYEIPPSIKAPKIEEGECIELKNQFIMLGDMSVAHNEVSTFFFLENYTEKIMEMLPGYIVKLVGKGVSERIEKLAQRYPEVIRISGFVPDIESELRDSVALLAPLLFGTGVKIKIIDAMSRGLPIIGTSIALDGVNFSEDGGGIFREDKLDNYVNLMRHISGECDLMELKRMTLMQYEKQYSEERIAFAYGAIFLGEKDA